MQKISGRATRVLGTRVHSDAPAKRKARATVVDATERVRGTTIAPAAKADTVLKTGANAALGFDYDAAAAGVRASLATFIAADTTNPPGNEARVIDLIAAALSKEGVEFQVTEFAPGRKNLVATLKGSGEAKPLVLLAHTDVVGTDGQPWSTPRSCVRRDTRCTSRRRTMLHAPGAHGGCDRPHK